VIRIRQCGRPYEELELEGSKAALSVLQQGILEFCESGRLAASVALPRQIDLRSGNPTIEGIRVCKTETLLLVSVSNGQLLISGRVDLLRVFAQNLPGTDGAKRAERRVRLDRLGLPNRVCEASLTVLVSEEVAKM
jgi:hypothetical protein